MSARFKGRRREVERLLLDITAWARSADNVQALVLVGSYARSQARMGSDVDLTVLCDNAEGYLADAA
jgi:predicted nucleotidyltransferase